MPRVRDEQWLRRAITITMFVPLLVLSMLAACARNTDPATTATGECRGMRFVAVSNHWRYGIDVYARGRRSSTPILLGTVTPGESREFALEPDQYIGYEVEGARRFAIPASERRFIQTRYLCR